jgi:hypothetical protein
MGFSFFILRIYRISHRHLSYPTYLSMNACIPLGGARERAGL